MDEWIDKKSRSFQRKGWNGNGSRMLALASWSATEQGTHVKRKFVDKDVFLIFVAISLAIKFLFDSVLLLIIVAMSTSYLVKKLVSKYSLGSVLAELEGDTQKVLVLKLMDLCEVKKIDPESIEDLSLNLNDALFCDRIFQILIKFINDDTKFYIL